MLRLQKHLLFPFHRSASLIHHRALLSTAAKAKDSRPHFPVEDYLVTTCGLTAEDAAKVSKYFSHCKSPSNADAVRAFLAGPPLGLSRADIASVVARDPRILNARVDETLRSRVDGFREHGFSPAQIRAFILSVPCLFRTFNIAEKLGFWLPFLGSPDQLLRIVRRNSYLVTSDLDGVVKANVRLLQDSGLAARDIAKMCVTNPRLLTTNPDSVRAIVARADDLGVPRDSLMFRQAVGTVAGLGTENLASKLKFMGDTLRCSAAEVAAAVKLYPVVLRCSREKFRHVSEFLIKVAGVDASYILRRPTLIMYSLEYRLAPRHYVMRKLLAKRLIRKDQSFYSMVTVSDKVFHARFIDPYKGALPGLADAYASACKGKIPT